MEAAAMVVVYWWKVWFLWFLTGVTVVMGVMEVQVAAGVTCHMYAAWVAELVVWRRTVAPAAEPVGIRENEDLGS